jgi:hypothetical protein
MIRIGIDVGGTFTKAVAVDRTSGQIMARAVVPTTHRAPSGVAEGAVAALLDLLAQERIRQDEIAFLTLSTTQAVNALLEGDVAPVGILAIGPRRERRQIQRLTRIERIDLAPGRTVPLHYVYLDRESVSESSLREAITSLRTAGAAVLAVSAAYAVEDPSSELMALEVAKEFDIPATAGSQLTGLYGLQVRTLTAAVNASILPKMRETTAWLRTALWEAGIRAPKMILTGDLSIAPIDQLAELPATSILSGPAASVTGALSSQPAVEALFVEVGGTSTNLGVIRNDGRHCATCAFSTTPHACVPSTCISLASAEDPSYASIAVASSVSGHGVRISLACRTRASRARSRPRFVSRSSPLSRVIDLTTRSSETHKDGVSLSPSRMLPTSSASYHPTIMQLGTGISPALRSSPWPPASGNLSTRSLAKYSWRQQTLSCPSRGNSSRNTMSGSRESSA